MRFFSDNAAAAHPAVIEAITRSNRLDTAYDGDALSQSLDRAFSEPGQWRLVPIRANRMPAAASYVRGEDGAFRAFKVDVLRVEGGKVAEITTFDATLFPAFGLPPVLP